MSSISTDDFLKDKNAIEAYPSAVTLFVYLISNKDTKSIFHKIL